MSNAILEYKGICKRFDKFYLRDITFSLPKGYIMGLAGSNGAGKTTSIRLLLNMLKRDSGEILVFGKDNSRYESVIKKEIGVVFDSNMFADGWTVDDTEKAISVFFDNWNHEEYVRLIQRFELPSSKKIKEFSRGMQMKLMLACAFSHDAKLLVLDEPTSGLDPVTRDELLEILQDYIKDGERSVLFSTHITTDLERIADYVTILHKGELFFTGSIDSLLDEYRIIKGKPSDLTTLLRKRIHGLRETEVGFEGLIATEDSLNYDGLILDTPTIEDIVVKTGTKGA